MSIVQSERTAAGTILCYGDSNTYGYAPTYLYESRYPDDVIWTNILSGRLDCKVINYGTCGREIPHSRTQIQHVRTLVRSLAAKEPVPIHLWILLGTNDLLNHAQFRAEDVASRMEIFLSGLSEEACVQNGAVHLRLIAPPCMQPGEWTWGEGEHALEESRRLGDAYRALAGRTGVSFTDASDWDIPLVYDGVHFSEEGHRRFAAGILKEIVTEQT